jgi:hypothetical protein
MRATLTVLSALAALAMALPAVAQESGQESGQAYSQGSQAGETPAQASETPRPAITGREARTIRQWYGTERLDTRQRLPVGIAPEIYLNAAVPRGMATEDLPQGLLEALPEHPGHSFARAGDTVVLIEDETGLVRGLLRNAI